MSANKRSRPKKTAKKTKIFDQASGVRRIARERVGAPPPARTIEPKDLRKKPKHKKQPGIDEMEH